MSIKILKLVNGDDVITTIVKSDGVVMENPARLMMFPDPETGNMGMALVPWCPYTDKKVFQIPLIHVIIIIEEEDVPEELTREYREKFGSGLVTPTKSDIIL